MCVVMEMMSLVPIRAASSGGKFLLSMIHMEVNEKHETKFF